MVGLDSSSFSLAYKLRLPYVITQLILVHISTPLESVPSGSSARNHLHPKLLSGREVEILVAKAHLVVRMIQLKIGEDLLLQVNM